MDPRPQNSDSDLLASRNKNMAKSKSSDINMKQIFYIRPTEIPYIYYQEQQSSPQ